MFFLIYFERFEDVNIAIEREKQIKGWTRNKKEDLIKEFNPNWKFLNDEIQRFFLRQNDKKRKKYINKR